jgi:hypothetical protein
MIVIIKIQRKTLNFVVTPVFLNVFAYIQQNIYLFELTSRT